MPSLHRASSKETPALRGKPIIVVQTLTESACAIAVSYPAKRLGIKTGTLLREARRICPAVIPVEADHRLYTEYHERILKAVDTCLPVEKVCSIDEMACRLMGAAGGRHEGPRTTGLYDRRSDDVSLDEMERIGI